MLARDPSRIPTAGVKFHPSERVPKGSAVRDGGPWSACRCPASVAHTVTPSSVAVSVREAMAAGRLPPQRRVLAVVAHPDDESFGLGAVLGAFVDAGSPAAVLCFTHGEASELHGGLDGDLHELRATELAAAAGHLGLTAVELLGYPDGRLDSVAIETLRDHVTAAVDRHGADILLAFDDSGVTGHPDHARATEAALQAAVARDLPLLAWALPERVAARLNSEYGTSFRGRPAGELDVELEVDRDRQLCAISQHATQSMHNPVLWRRLELLGHREWLRVAHP